MDEAALPVVLSLLDQLYETRRQMRRIRTAIETGVPEDLRLRLLQDLGRVTGALLPGRPKLA